MTLIEKSTLLEALRKNYQERTIQDHKVLNNMLAPCFPTHSKQKIRLTSFYLELRQGPAIVQSTQYPRYSFSIIFEEKDQFLIPSIGRINHNEISIHEGSFICILNYQKHLNVQTLGDTTLEKQLNFWESSEYFCSMPKKKLLQMMRNTQVRIFHENEIAFFQGQQLTRNESGSGVYVVRTGEFIYFRQSEGRQIETFRFASGSIFGSLQILEKDTQRSMTARCKTQNSIIYHFSEQFFQKVILRYCQLAIRKKQNKLFKFIDKKGIQMLKSKSLSTTLKRNDKFSEKNLDQPFSTNFQSLKSMRITERNAFPRIKVEEIRQATTTRFFESFKESTIMEKNGTKGLNYFTLRKEGPLKCYPMASQRSNFNTSEFKILDKLLATRKQVGKQQSIANIQNQTNKLGAFQRNSIHSFYREHFFKRFKKNPEVLQQ